MVVNEMEDQVVEVRKLLTNPPNTYGVVDIFAKILGLADWNNKVSIQCN
jgi:hypothetical protein